MNIVEILKNLLKTSRNWLKNNILTLLKLAVHTHTILLALFLLSILYNAAMFNLEIYIDYYNSFMSMHLYDRIAIIIVIPILTIFIYAIPFRIVFPNYIRYASGIPSYEGRVYWVQNYGLDKKIRQWANKYDENKDIRVWFSMGLWNIFLPLKCLYTITGLKNDDIDRNGLFRCDIIEDGRRYRKLNSGLDFVVVKDGKNVKDELSIELPDAKDAERVLTKCITKQGRDVRETIKADVNLAKRQAESTSFTIPRENKQKLDDIDDK